MQTFLPYRDFAESARVLHMKHLGKQRVEVMQILKALDGRFPDAGWANHPATKMWFGYPVALIRYGLAICTEWISRGYKDTCYAKIADVEWSGLFVRAPGTTPDPGEVLRAEHLPPWVGDAAFHAAHRSNLLRKKPEHYRVFWPDEPDDLEYVYPAPWVGR